MATPRKQPLRTKKSDLIKAAELVAAVNALDFRVKQTNAPELSTPAEAAVYAREQGVDTTPSEILEEVKVQRSRHRRANTVVTATSQRPPVKLGAVWIAAITFAACAGLSVGAALLKIYAWSHPAFHGH